VKSKFKGIRGKVMETFVRYETSSKRGPTWLNGGRNPTQGKRGWGGGKSPKSWERKIERGGGGGPRGLARLQQGKGIRRGKKDDLEKANLPDV